MRVRDVMTTPVITVHPGTSFKELVELMLGNGVSSLPVVDEEGILLGVVSESDLLPREARYRDKPAAKHRGLLGAFKDLMTGQPAWMRKANGSNARALMTHGVAVAEPSEPLRAVARRMVRAGRKHVPVVLEGRVVGMLSRSDVLKLFAASDDDIADAVIEQLNRCGYRPPDAVIDVQVKDGLVHLSGAVERASDVPVIHGVLRWVEGIVEVEDDLSYGRDDRKVS